MFDKNDTKQKVVDVIAQIISSNPATIQVQATLETLGADSLDRLEIIMKLEELFGIDISDEDESAVKTVHDVIELVHAKRLK